MSTYSGSSCTVLSPSPPTTEPNEPHERGSAYPGQGTAQDPYVVDWIKQSDPENPYNWSNGRKWLLTYQLALGTLCVSFASSSYTGALAQTKADLKISQEIAVLGITVYVIGFGIGPVIFAPLSEIFGRRNVFLASFIPFCLFQIPCALAPNAAVLIVFRFLAGTFGSSPLSNAGGAIADIWRANERGVATSLYSSGPWVGPIIGPLVGGLLMESQRLRWRFVFWITFILAAIPSILGIFFMPETYAPILLRRRAQALHKQSGGTVYYISVHDQNHESETVSDKLLLNMKRPFIYLFTEPIVMLLAIYIALLYGSLYATFISFPIIFQEHKGWSPVLGGVAFFGMGLGVAIGNFLAPLANRVYMRDEKRSPTGVAAPESRLKSGMLGGILAPIGLFWFSWTTLPGIHPIVPIIGTIPFGTGILLVFLSVVSYLMDTYKHYCASAIAATVVLRSLLGAVFPLFTAGLFKKLGDQWAASVFAFLALACAPLPFIFFRFGKTIRSHSRVASQLHNLPNVSEKKATGTV